nr:hypothetical protein HK105_004033 [Polyrhizophydium stewartii]
MHIHPQPAVHPAHYTGFDHPYVSQEHLHFADHHAQQHYADHAQHDQYAAHYAAAYASPFAGDYAPAPHIRTASATDTASSHATSLATSRSTSPRLLHPQPQALVHTLPHADLAAAQRQAPPAKRMTPPRATTASAGRATKKQRPFVPPSDFDDSRDLPTCNICGQSFTRLFNLNSHLQSHENVKPFVCDYCGMSFTRRHDLNRHVRQHLPERPFDALKRHYRMHNGKDDKPRPAES